MKIIYTFFTLLFIACLPLHAQLKQVAEGPVFEDPANGYVKILLMENGNTAYVYLRAKDIIDVRIYDADRNEKIAVSSDINFDRARISNNTSRFSALNVYEEVMGVFEIKNDICLFVHEVDRGKSILYRIIIDGSTGKVKEEKAIFDEKWSSFDVKKDTYSDNYVVKVNNLFYAYDKDHKEISRSGFKSPEADHAYPLYYDMIVIGKDKVCIFFTATSGKETDRKGNLYMATIEKGSEKISYDKLNLPGDVICNNLMIKYDPVSKKIILLTGITLSTGDYESYVNIIDPVSKKMDKVSGFGIAESLNQAYIEKFDKKKGYAGYPQDIFINDDESISIIYEEIAVQRTSTTGYSRTDTKLGKIVINTINRQGKLLSSYLVPKEHWIIFTELYITYHYKQEANAQIVWKGNQYKPFKYIDGAKGRFIFFNDTERNIDVKKDRFTEVQAVTDCDAFMFKLSDSDFFPKRAYAFGEPGKGHTIAMFSASEYDKKTNTLVALKLDNTRNKKVKLVWLQPE